MNLILCGYHCCGKTTLGQRMAQELETEFIDTDALILSTSKHTNIRELHQQLGEKKFRALEAELIQTINPITPTVIATGGGSFMDKQSAEHLQSLGVVIYLYVEPDVLWQRINQQDSLPSFIDPAKPKQSFAKHFAERDKLYRTVASKVI